jgi:restriction system protein
LQQEGFEDVCRTPKTGDQGADLLVKKDGRKIAIQAKRYTGSVGNEAVQEIVGALEFYGADEGWVITSGTFSPSARALAQKAASSSSTGSL